MSRRRVTQFMGVTALALGVLILVRDAIQVHSVPYAIAGVGMLAFGAWRLQAAATMRR